MNDHSLMTADQWIDQLMSLHPKGYDLSLDRITGLLAKLDNPQDKLPPVLHVAGTNGKGSFTAFARALLEAEGYKVHVHTSPHLVSWHERFRLAHEDGGKLVEDHVLANAIARVAAANDGAAITVFEILSVVMFLLFSEHEADVAIIEVGLGGRFDATNVITSPAASIIMPVSLDHQMLLGDTAAKIAFEKAGIIKKNCPTIISAQPFDDALDVITHQAEKNRSAYSVFGQDFAGFEEHGRFVYQDENGLLDLPKPQLIGQHQYANAATAIRAVKDAGFTVTQSSAERAMKSVYWPGRMQSLPHGQLADLISGLDAEIYIDGGHNPDAANIIVNSIKQMDERPLYLISAMLNTKEPHDFFEKFADKVEHLITIPVVTSDAGIPADKLAAIAQQSGIAAQSGEDLTSAFRSISKLHRETDHTIPPRILICGSLYLVGDVLAQNGTPPE
jgi:dihydrofolate synthase/folylpolyglutamate synthase